MLQKIKTLHINKQNKIQTHTQKVEQKKRKKTYFFRKRKKIQTFFQKRQDLPN